MFDLAAHILLKTRGRCRDCGAEIDVSELAGAPVETTRSDDGSATMHVASETTRCPGCGGGRLAVTFGVGLEDVTN